jgi:hypothetical protein
MRRLLGDDVLMNSNRGVACSTSSIKVWSTQDAQQSNVLDLRLFRRRAREALADGAAERAQSARSVRKCENEYTLAGKGELFGRELGRAVRVDDGVQSKRFGRVILWIRSLRSEREKADSTVEARALLHKAPGAGKAQSLGAIVRALKERGGELAGDWQRKQAH